MMRQKFYRVSLFSAAMTFGGSLAAPSAHAQDQFGYPCTDCPSNWGNLDNDPADGDDAPFEACRIGASQSPVDLGHAKRRHLPKLVFDYHHAELETIDKRVNVELEANLGGLRVGGKFYSLKQFHFHSLSEHFVAGEQLPLEMHLVHQANDGSLAVVARFIEIGDAFEGLDAVIDAIESEAGGHPEELGFDLSAFVPKSKRSFRYSGSTTTPPCTEDVLWIAIHEKLSASEEQVERIQETLRELNHGFDNVRPLQSLNGRQILTDVRPRRGDDDD